MINAELKQYLKKLLLGEILSLVSLFVIIGRTANIPYLGVLTLAAIASLIIGLLAYNKLRKENEQFNKAFLIFLWNKSLLIISCMMSMVPGTGGFILFGGFLAVYSVTYILLADQIIKGIREYLRLDEVVKYHNLMFGFIIFTGIVLFIISFLSPFDFVTTNQSILISFGIIEMISACVPPALVIILLSKSSKDIDNPVYTVRDKKDVI